MLRLRLRLLFGDIVPAERARYHDRFVQMWGLIQEEKARQTVPGA